MIRFDDGAAYERSMGGWSQLAGHDFLDWLAPAQGLGWVDVGCGNGAFTELIRQRCAPSRLDGVDPSEGQLAFARTRLGEGAMLHQGDAMALPFAADSFDAAVMALVIFFVPDPAQGVAEMARVVRPGGLVATYAWDFAGGGFPLRLLGAELHAEGAQTLRPPSVGIEQFDALRELWTRSGLTEVETRRIEVRRSFASFAAYWDSVTATAGLRATLDALPPEGRAAVKERLRARLPPDAEGRVGHTAIANAIKGRVPLR